MSDGGADGVLVVDKPSGPTSHDVVRWARRAFATRAVGHAGTLDPLATGVLVVAIGEATKLVSWLTADDKAYRASVALGVETDTLDEEGKAVAMGAPVEPITLERARAVARSFVGAGRQRPPAFSAIKLGGRRSHERARRGESIEMPERDVLVHRLEVLAASDDSLELELLVAKGFYVRSLARDLALALGTRGHLRALRRTASGPFRVEDAVDGALLERASRDGEASASVRAVLTPLEVACRLAMPALELDPQGVVDARHGRAVAIDHVVQGSEARGREPLGLFDGAGKLVAIGSWRSEELRVLRGMRPS